MSNSHAAGPTGPDPQEPAGSWPPAQEMFRRGRGRARSVVIVGLCAVIGGGALVTALQGRDGTGSVAVVLVPGGAMSVIGGALLLHQWGRIRRALDTSSWQPVRVRLTMTPGGKGLYDALFDDGRMALARNSVTTGSIDRSGLLQTTGYATFPDTVDCLIAAGTADPTVLTSLSGAVLIPLRGPRSPRQQRRWRTRWDRRLDAAHQPRPDSWATPPEARTARSAGDLPK